MPRARRGADSSPPGGTASAPPRSASPMSTRSPSPASRPFRLEAAMTARNVFGSGRRSANCVIACSIWKDAASASRPPASCTSHNAGRSCSRMKAPQWPLLVGMLAPRRQTSPPTSPQKDRARSTGLGMLGMLGMFSLPPRMRARVRAHARGRGQKHPQHPQHPQTSSDHSENSGGCCGGCSAEAAQRPPVPDWLKEVL